MKKKFKEKMFVVKKYIMAKNAQDALRKEKNHPADDCWVDEEWRKNKTDNLASAIGFEIENEKEN